MKKGLPISLSTSSMVSAVRFLGHPRIPIYFPQAAVVDLIRHKESLDDRKLLVRKNAKY